MLGNFAGEMVRLPSNNSLTRYQPSNIVLPSIEEGFTKAINEMRIKQSPLSNLENSRGSLNGYFHLLFVTKQEIPLATHELDLIFKSEELPKEIGQYGYNIDLTFEVNRNRLYLFTKLPRYLHKSLNYFSKDSSSSKFLLSCLIDTLTKSDPINKVLPIKAECLSQAELLKVKIINSLKVYIRSIYLKENSQLILSKHNQLIYELKELINMEE